MHVSTRSYPGQRLLTVEHLTPRGLPDQAVGLRVLQSNEPGPVSSTISISVSDAWVWLMSQRSGTCERLALVEQLAHTLERPFSSGGFGVR